MDTGQLYGIKQYSGPNAWTPSNYNSWVAAGRPSTNAQGQTLDVRGQVMQPDAWDNWAKTMQQNFGTGQSTLANLGQTTQQQQGPIAPNQSGLYTGFGGSSLHAPAVMSMGQREAPNQTQQPSLTGNPQYGYGLGGALNVQTQQNRPVANYYAGTPIGSTAPKPVAPVAPRTPTAPVVTAPVMPTLNNTLTRRSNSLYNNNF